jgi:hypothetical protein
LGGFWLWSKANTHGPVVNARQRTNAFIGSRAYAKKKRAILKKDAASVGLNGRWEP